MPWQNPPWLTDASQQPGGIGAASGYVPAQGFPPAHGFPPAQGFPPGQVTPSAPGSPSAQGFPPPSPAQGFPYQGFSPAQGFEPPRGSQPVRGFEPARRRPRPLLWGLGAAAVLVTTGAVLVTGFVAPGWFVRTEFNARAVEDGVTQTLRDSYRVDGVNEVRCPDGQRVEPTHRFTCQVAMDSGPGVVTVTVKNERGLYEVTRPR